ncbi:DUF4838 domain-containing protein [Flavobacterium sp. M31R6]|uniref:DUF4838 domain-containing protein n=1 Tax=Flavobacterium sp. M31R6 TaxID=2739062 RepID=UPI0020C310F5|nr:DUF4838 domain-containing protein [Flavobacterium sp. M31R6]
MAQNSLNLTNTKGQEVFILSTSDATKNPATLLKTYLDQAFENPILIQVDKTKSNGNSKIILEIASNKNATQENSFVIKSDEKNIYLIGSNEKTLRYAVYTLLEIWGFRKYTANDNFIPKLKQVSFPKNSNQIYKPSFEYRALFYPDCYDEAFREWHKLDWHIDDFGIWGHSFYKLLSAKTYFKTNPEFFAYYEGERNSESLCMSNDTVVEIVTKKMSEIIAQNPNASFFSVSQNDDVVYCECTRCKTLNEKYGGPQGSFYYFLNKIASQFPKTQITTLAYLHTYRAPVNLKIEPNIYTLFCPIELNRGKAISEVPNNAAFLDILKNWSTTAQHFYLWDYTVEFTNYLSPFPNFQTFSKNYKLFEQNQVKGLFVQGYADVPGDLYELRQYLLAKIIWDTQTDVEAVTNDFLNGFYGNAAPFVKKYIDLLTQYQEKTDRYLDIYSDPIQNRNTFLTPEAMDQYDQIISQAEKVSVDNPIIAKRVLKLRMSLEYVYFEQAKFYGKDKHGMFTDKNKEDQGKQLRERVLNFSKNCNDFGIYELSEGGLTPDQYYQEWLAIEKNTCNHLGEKYEVRFLTSPADENKGKGTYGLVDGVRGYKNPAINWIGWYGTNPEIEITTRKLNFNTIRINSLNDQRHWIFTPKKISIYGLKKNKWQLITQQESEELSESLEVTIKPWEFKSDNFNRYDVLKIEVENLKELPIWRKRKNKKPMVMIDEIELYNK